MRIASHLFFFYCCLVSITTLRAKEINEKDLLKSMQDGLDEIEEIRWLKKEMKKLKVHGWMFGGTGFTYAHYRKRVAEGTSPSSAKRVADIYGPTQDFDIVIDGDEWDARRLEEDIRAKFPYMLPPELGGKSVWEVRLLRSARQGKVALLDDPQYASIHNDTGSTGLISITGKDPLLADVTTWDKGVDNAVLKDIVDHRLHFLFRPDHMTTPRAQKGKNPEVMSVIRYFAKIFQENLWVEQEAVDLHIVPILQRFPGKANLHPEYGPDRLRRLIVKMVVQSRDTERTYAWIERLNLAKVFHEFGPKDERGTILWWLTRHPLKAQAPRKGGKTAKAMGLKEAWFAVPDALSLSLALRSPRGAMNMFEEDFALNTETEPFLIKLALDPNAEEGTDFAIKGDRWIPLNRNVIWPATEQLAASEIEKRSLSQRILGLSPADNSNTEWDYLSKNGDLIAAGLAGIDEGANTVILSWLEYVNEARRRNLISSRDHRRLLARGIGRLTIDEATLAGFAELFQRWPEMGKIFIERRGVFVDSAQMDAGVVRENFLRIEARLVKDCGHAFVIDQKSE